MRDEEDSDIVIATLLLDHDSFAWLDGLRRVHFPPARNHLAAHLTLFHRLSPEQAARMAGVARQHKPMPLVFNGVRLLGGGVAIDVASDELHAFRAGLMSAADGEFSAQDRQPFKPHVTVQNKVAAKAAKALFELLAAEFVTREGTGIGLGLWNYLGGPWAERERIVFSEWS